MSSPAVLDIEALVQPIPGADPAGAPLPDGLRLELDDARKEPDPLDPATAGRNPDWGKLVRVTSDALTKTSKDLLAAARLLEAVTKRAGTAGLRDGLQLLHRLVTDCWDWMHPMPGEGEGMEVREGPMKWLNDVTRGARFPQTVGQLPVVKAGGQTFTYFDSLSPARKAELDEPTNKVDAKALRLAYEDLVESRNALRRLAAVLDEKMGADVAPDFLSPETSGNIGTAIGNCIGFVEDVAKRRGVALVDAPAGEGSAAGGDSSGESGGTSSGSGGGIAGGREGLYRQLGQIATALRHLEPHSPIPYLLERCVRLGALSFPELMRAMIRENAALDELDRLIGVEKTES